MQGDYEFFYFYYRRQKFHQRFLLPNPQSLSFESSRIIQNSLYSLLLYHASNKFEKISTRTFINSNQDYRTPSNIQYKILTASAINNFKRNSYLVIGVIHDSNATSNAGLYIYIYLSVSKNSEKTEILHKIK